MLGKGALRQLLAIGLPKLRACVLRCCGRAPNVVDYDEVEGLQKLEFERALGPHRGTFYEYNEMAIQFGYLTMFASVAPWAACVCMLVNEVRVGVRVRVRVRVRVGLGRVRVHARQRGGAAARTLTRNPNPNPNPQP